MQSMPGLGAAVNTHFNRAVRSGEGCGFLPYAVRHFSAHRANMGTGL